MNERKLQELLRLKKLETPGREYFDRFLGEFQRYQRAEMFRRASRWEPVRAWFRELFVWEPRRALTVGGCCALAAAALTVSVASFSKGSVSGSGSGYVKHQAAPQAQLVSDAEGDTPRYSTGQTPPSYDKTIAF